MRTLLLVLIAISTTGPVQASDCDARTLLQMTRLQADYEELLSLLDLVRYDVGESVTRGVLRIYFENEGERGAPYEINLNDRRARDFYFQSDFRSNSVRLLHGRANSGASAVDFPTLKPPLRFYPVRKWVGTVLLASSYDKRQRIWASVPDANVVETQSERALRGVVDCPSADVDACFSQVRELCKRCDASGNSVKNVTKDIIDCPKPEACEESEISYFEFSCDCR